MSNTFLGFGKQDKKEEAVEEEQSTLSGHLSLSDATKAEIAAEVKDDEANEDDDTVIEPSETEPTKPEPASAEAKVVTPNPKQLRYQQLLR